MQITENGKQEVASLEFALGLACSLVDLHAAGVPDELANAVADHLIGWVLTGHCVDRMPMTSDEWAALQRFCNSHAAEIGDVFVACVAMLHKTLPLLTLSQQCAPHRS